MDRIQDFHVYHVSRYIRGLFTLHSSLFTHSSLYSFVWYVDQWLSTIEMRFHNVHERVSEFLIFSARDRVIRDFLCTVSILSHISHASILIFIEEYINMD